MKSCIVKRSFSIKDLFPSFIALTLSLLVGVAALFLMPSLFIPALAVGIIIAAYLAHGSLFTEYEYNIEADTFSVALIRNKASRKELFSCDIENLILCEPCIGQKTPGTRLNYSEDVNTLYVARFLDENKNVSVIFSPDEAFVRELFLIAPAKVKRNIM